MKTKPSKKKVAKKKALVVPDRTRNSKSIKSLKWKLKDERTKGTCCKVGCSKTGVQGIFCKKHKKILRKEQLRLNNIPWRAKVKKMGKKYVPDQPHLVYSGVATKFAIVKKKEAIKRVKAEQSVLTSVKDLEKAIALRKKKRMSMKVAEPKKKEPKAKVISLDKHRKAKAKKEKVKTSKAKTSKKAASDDEFDFS